MRRRVRPAWNRLQTLASQKVPFVQAMEEIAPLMYPPEAEAECREREKAD
jgi:hypothetical protein